MERLARSGSSHRLRTAICGSPPELLYTSSTVCVSRATRIQPTMCLPLSRHSWVMHRASYGSASGQGTLQLLVRKGCDASARQTECPVVSCMTSRATAPVESGWRLSKESHAGMAVAGSPGRCSVSPLLPSTPYSSRVMTLSGPVPRARSFVCHPGQIAFRRSRSTQVGPQGLRSPRMARCGLPNAAMVRCVPSSHRTVN